MDPNSSPDRPDGRAVDNDSAQEQGEQAGYKGRRHRLGTGTVLTWILPLIYVPTSFGFLSDCSHCRGLWLWIWPVSPGAFCLAALFGPGTSLHIGILYGIATLLTIAYVTGLTWLGKRGWRWLVGSAIGGATLSLLSALALYGAIRA